MSLEQQFLKDNKFPIFGLLPLGFFFLINLFNKTKEKKNYKIDDFIIISIDNQLIIGKIQSIKNEEIFVSVYYGQIVIKYNDIIGLIDKTRAIETLKN